MSAPALIPCPACNGLNRIPSERLGDAPRCGRCKSPVLPAAPITLNQASFAAQLKGDLPLLVDVWADWCGPCKAFAPTFAQAAAQLQGRCRLGKLDSEANPQLSAQLGIQHRIACGASHLAVETGFEAGLVLAHGRCAASLFRPGLLGFVTAGRPSVEADIQHQNDTKGDDQSELKITHTFSF